MSEELLQADRLPEAQAVLLKGIDGGLWPTDGVIDSAVAQACEAGRHADAHEVMDALAQRAWRPTTFHHNCILKAMVSGSGPSWVTE